MVSLSNHERNTLTLVSPLKGFALKVPAASKGVVLP